MSSVIVATYASAFFASSASSSLRTTAMFSALELVLLLLDVRARVDRHRRDAVFGDLLVEIQAHVVDRAVVLRAQDHEPAEGRALARLLVRAAHRPLDNLRAIGHEAARRREFPLVEVAEQRLMPVDDVVATVDVFEAGKGEVRILVEDVAERDESRRGERGHVVVTGATLLRGRPSAPASTGGAATFTSSELQSTGGPGGRAIVSVAHPTRRAASRARTARAA